MIGFIKGLAPLLLYIAGICAFIACFCGQVRYGLFFLVPLLPLQNVVEKLQGFPMGKDLNDIVIAGMFIGWIISRVSRREQIMSPSSLNKILMSYFFYTYFTLWMGSHYLGTPPPIDPGDYRVELWKNYMVLPALFFITFNNLRAMKEFKMLFLLMCLSICLMNYYNVQQVKDMTSWFSRVKVHGTFMWLGANEVAAFYATYNFVLLGMAVFLKDKRWKIFLAVLILTGFYISLFMFSRGAYIAILGGMLLFALLKKKILIIPIVILICTWQSVLPKEVSERVHYSEHEGTMDESASTRLVLWQQSMNYFKESPIFGVGFQVFVSVGLQRDTHNIFLRTLAEQGIIGVLYLLVIMGISFKRGLHLYRIAEDPFLKGLGLGFCCCAASMIICNIFGDRWTPLPLAAFFWIFLGMVERGILMSSEQKAPVKKEEKKRVKVRVRANPRLDYGNGSLGKT